MSLVLVAEIAQSGKYGVRRGLTQTAERRALYVLCKLFELIKVFHLALALGDLCEKLKHSYRTDTAGSALTAGLVHGELKEELCKVYHTGILVHDDKSAGAHHGADGDKVIVVNGCIYKACGDASAGGTAGLRRFELLAVGDTAADLFYDLTKGGTHRNLNKTGVGDLAAESEHFCALGLFGTHGGKPIRALENYLRDVSVCLNVVEDGGLLKQTLYCGERRTGTGLAALTLD